MVAATNGVLANDSDADGDTLTASVYLNPSHGTVSMAPSGSFTYTPTTGFHGTDAFYYRAYDGRNYTTQYVKIKVNAAPIATDDSYEVAEGSPLSISSPAVLANDNDADSDPLTAILVAGPAHGSLSLNPNGSFVYTPNDLYTGPDSFTYKASDGAADSTATVSLNVLPLNSNLTANDQFYSTDADTPVNSAAPGLLDGAGGPAGGNLGVLLLSMPAHGTVSIGSDGTFRYTPNLTYSGSDSFTYCVTDGSSVSEPAIAYFDIQDVEDIVLSNFYSDGTNLLVQYLVVGDAVPAFQIGVYRSDDGTTAGAQLETVAGDTSQGLHTATITPTYTDPQEDYYLVAAVDTDDSVAEGNEANNVASFQGGAFIDREASTGTTILEVQGTDAVDAISVDFQPDQEFGPYWTVSVPQAALATPAWSPDAPFPDVTGNGIVNQFDADAIYGAVAATYQDSWHNPSDPFDVTGDGFESPADALVLINSLTALGEQELVGQPPAEYFPDVATDGVLSLLDVSAELDKLSGGSGNVSASGRNPWNAGDVNADGVTDQQDYWAIEYLLSAGSLTYNDPYFSSIHVRAHGGNDAVNLSGSEAPTWVFGGTGDDTIFGSYYQQNMIDGGDGDDTIQGGDFNNNILGGNGNDIITGGGNDIIDGGDGNDTIYEIGGFDEIYGGAGDDTIQGGADGSILLGGDGNDTITGGDGQDYIEGDGGSDVLSGGGDLDHIWGDFGPNYVLFVPNGDGQGEGEGEGSIAITPDRSDDTIHGDGGDDVIDAGEGNDSVYGDDGNDSIQGGSGNDYIEGDDGDDTISGGAGYDMILGGTGTNNIDEGPDDDDEDYIAYNDSRFTTDLALATPAASFSYTDVYGHEGGTEYLTIYRRSSNAPENYIWDGDLTVKVDIFNGDPNSVYATTNSPDVATNGTDFDAPTSLTVTMPAGVGMVRVPINLRTNSAHEADRWFYAVIQTVGPYDWDEMSIGGEAHQTQTFYILDSTIAPQDDNLLYDPRVLDSDSGTVITPSLNDLEAAYQLYVPLPYVKSFTQPAHGKLTRTIMNGISPDDPRHTLGALLYTPDVGYFGDDEFSYVASNGFSMGSATVHLAYHNYAPSDVGFQTWVATGGGAIEQIDHETDMEENQPALTVVGTLIYTDQPGDVPTFSLVAGTGDNDNDSFMIDGDQLLACQGFDFETQPTYQIRVQAKDRGGLTVERTLVIHVTNVNEAPTDITLSNSTVEEHQVAGAGVGALTATDPDADDYHTFAIVGGDTTSFAIQGDLLVTGAAFDYQTKNIYSVTIRATDLGGLSTEKSFSIRVKGEAGVDLLDDANGDGAINADDEPLKSDDPGIYIVVGQGSPVDRSLFEKVKLSFQLASGASQSDYEGWHIALQIVTDTGGGGRLWDSDSNDGEVVADSGGVSTVSYSVDTVPSTLFFQATSVGKVTLQAKLFDANGVERDGDTVLFTAIADYGWLPVPRQKSNNITQYFAKREDATLEALANLVTGDPDDWSSIWPTGDASNWTNYDPPADGSVTTHRANYKAVADVSNLTATTGKTVIIFQVRTDRTETELPAMTAFVKQQQIPGARIFTFQDTDYGEIPKIIARESDQGHTPIQKLIIVHHWDGEAVPASSLGLWIDAAKDKLGRGNIYDLAKDKNGPIRSWFTHNADYIDIACFCSPVADWMATNILRKGAMARGTLDNLYPRQLPDGNVVAGFDMNANKVFEPATEGHSTLTDLLAVSSKWKSYEGKR